MSKSSLLGNTFETANKAVSDKKTKQDKQDKQDKGNETLEADNVLLKLPVNKIHPDPDQPRDEWIEGELEDLAATIKSTDGCSQPIKVRPHPELDGEYMIIFGEGRWLAHQRLDMTHINSMLVTKPIETAADMYAVRFEQVVENVSRNAMSKLDEAKAIKNLIDTHEPKITQGDFSKKIGLQQTYISRLMKLLKAPESIKDLSKEHVTQNLNLLSYLTNLYKLVENEEFELYLEQVRNGELTEKAIQQKITELKNPEKAKNVSTRAEEKNRLGSDLSKTESEKTDSTGIEKTNAGTDTDSNDSAELTFDNSPVDNDSNDNAGLTVDNSPVDTDSNDSAELTFDNSPVDSDSNDNAGFTFDNSPVDTDSNDSAGLTFDNSSVDTDSNDSAGLTFDNSSVDAGDKVELDNDADSTPPKTVAKEVADHVNQFASELEMKDFEVNEATREILITTTDNQKLLLNAEDLEMIKIAIAELKIK